ncbi:MAG TPA: gluconate 2-dehydrogenase subunit 3 family protein [Gemmatimonadaceae bacterium]|nr:gluconate 2-dehydrogenase subunit 3 family protein [Gemmatimonadaceae bacterium]
MSTTNDDRELETASPASTDATISRRRMLQVLGAVPVAAALSPATALEQVTSQTQAAAAVQAAAPRFFTQHEWRTLRVLVDYIIPRDDVSGSATDAKVPEYMDYLLAEKDANPATQVAMRGGLAWIDTESEKRFAKTFVAATDQQRRQILDDIAFPQKAPPGVSHGVAFFNRLRDMTASGFYSSALGWKDLQYIGNVFNPGYDGCPPAALEKLGVTYDLMTTRVSPEQK